VLLLLSAIGVRWLCLPFQSADMGRFLLPWMDYLVAHGRFRALADDFYDYAPAYMYLLAAASLLSHQVSAVALIKLVTFLFEILAAVFIFRLAEAAWGDRRRALLCALLFLNLPTVILNGSLWGQCDIVYTSFLLGFLYFAIRSRPILAVVMYGLALSFKLQSIFLAPLLVFLIARKRIPPAALLIVPAVYVALALPAVLAGRPLWDLLTIYARQAGENGAYLALGAPNIDHLIETYLAPDAVPLATKLNLAIAGILSAALLAWQLRMRPALSAELIVIASAFWLAVEPLILPKMHERYFFPADVFSFVLAIWMPRRWWIAALFQLGSMLAYATFLLVSAGYVAGFRLAVDARVSYDAAVLIILATLSLGILLWQTARQRVMP
jgi:Gpi18-like mannosyltransferase